MEWATDMVSGCVSGAPLGARAPDRTFKPFYGRTIPERRLDQPSEDRRANGAGRFTASLGLLVLPASTVRAQDAVLQRLNIDKLQITSLGASFGRIAPSQVEPTNIIGIQADYGNISPHWRV